MIHILSGWVEKRWPWALLALSAMSLECTALYFQHVMGLDPCMMCVYERAATFGIIIAGAIVLVNPKNIYFRLAGFLLWAYCAIKGLLIAIEHVSIQFSTNPFASTCDFFPNFWVPLDNWLPFLFKPTGYCEDIQWMFMGLSMPQWLVVCYSIYLAILAAVLFCRLLANKKP